MAATLPTAAVRLVPATSLRVSKPTWWLESRFHFSFADYWDPARMQFGALRVMNDDLVKPRAGFGRHPHRHAEIFSYILEGSLSHADSMGSKESLPRGCVQYMSAGRGVTHSEMNDHDETCRFIQVWFTPDSKAPGYGSPKYGSSCYTKADRHNQLLHMLSGTGPSPAWPAVNSSKDPIQLYQDGNVFVSESDAGSAYELQLAARRQAYILCMEGSMSVNDGQLQARDAAKVKGGEDGATLLKLSTAEGAHFMLIEMAKSDDE
uniref:Pirin N-terminal domain-containing protein n=1 Tax=Tetradesmus obliquus TaxID=3088 RepID=A0A383VZA5_TETOB|eukprot:jgi/Sobl393_1/7326/SZX70551.1